MSLDASLATPSDQVTAAQCVTAYTRLKSERTYLIASLLGSTPEGEEYSVVHLDETNERIAASIFANGVVMTVFQGWGEVDEAVVYHVSWLDDEIRIASAHGGKHAGVYHVRAHKLHTSADFVALELLRRYMCALVYTDDLPW